MGGFRFKEFAVEQELCAMKVGTDGVLLGAWAPLPDSGARLLDIGTGTGLIALMLAQRMPSARITALDLDPQCVRQARENVARSPWAERIEVVEGAVQHFTAPCPYDLVVSNPPYFENSLLSPDADRTRARHTQSLPFGELLEAVNRLLAPEGHFAVVLPTDAVSHFLLLAASRLSAVRRLDVRTTLKRPPKRTLLLMPHNRFSQPLLHEELVIHPSPGCFSPQYQELTRDFYLKF